MSDEIQYQGMWHLPTAPKKQVSGTLSYMEGKRLKLELFGELTTMAESMQVGSVDVIHGITADGRPVTLLDSIEYTRTESFGGFPCSTFSPHFAFVGKHFDSENDVRFDELYVQYRNLEEWANISGFKFDFSQLPREQIIKYSHLEPVVLAKLPSCNISLTFTWKGPAINLVQKQARIEQTTFICIRCDNRLFFEEFSDRLREVGRLLALAITEPSPPINVRGLIRVNHSKPQIVEVLTDWVGGELPARSMLPSQMLFTYSDAQEQTQKMFENWFSKAGRFGPTCNLYFSTLYNPRGYVEDKFYDLVRAVEIYHRRTKNNEELPENQHDRRIQNILSAVREHDVAWLKAKLEYSNEPSLRKRLKNLIAEYSYILNDLITDEKKFVNKVTNTRNYLTHYDPKLKRNTAEGKDLIVLSLRLRLLLETIFLDELGFDRKKIEVWIRRTNHYRLLLQWGEI